MYCLQCGLKLVMQQNGDDSVMRPSCGACGFVLYENPKILVSCFAYWEDRVLWIRRNTPPYVGSWAIPSGFMEQNESLQTGAARELYEETEARVDMAKMQLYTVGSLVTMNQIYVVFRAPLLSPEFKPTSEASEVALFSESEYPWAESAFPDVDINVRQFYRELQVGHFEVYTGVIENGVNIVSKITPDA